MQSGIFAIATVGEFKLYIGELSQLQPRWQEIVEQLREGLYPDPRLQQAWREDRRRRQFTFYTALEIAGDDSILGRQNFFTDLKTLAQQRSPRPLEPLDASFDPNEAQKFAR
ncbi:MAG: hypothetical protein SW833_17315 [Cyanobacteriota bacterium]|nr:hypothetical protein [Cyanobacteriota bacterium]